MVIISVKGGNGFTGRYGVEAGRDAAGQIVVIVTELQANTGPSVTNNIENIVKRLRETMPQLAQADDRGEVMWVETYETGRGYSVGQWDRVTFDRGFPSWHRLPGKPEIISPWGPT